MPGHADVDERTYPDRLDAGLIRIAGVCVLAVMMAVLDTTIVAVAQRTFVLEFASSQAVVAWTMTAYTLTLAAVIPVAGWAADRFGTKRLFMVAVVAFTAGSLLCSMAPTITLLIVFRIVQGIGGGMLSPLALTILAREAGPQRIGRLMALLGIPIMLAPVAGPVLSGWLIDSYGWPWIFRINVPMGVLTLIAAGIVFAKDRAAPSETFDVVGMLLLSPGLAALLYGISSVAGYGTPTDPHVWLPAAIGVAMIGGFVFHALHRADNPLLDLRLLTNRTTSAANATMFLSTAAVFGVALLLPSCLQQLLRETPLQSGVHLMPLRLAPMLTMPIAGILLDRRGPGKVVVVGVTLIGAGLGIFGYGVWTQSAYLPTLLAGLAIMGLGLGCTAMPLAAASVQAMVPRQISRGSALYHVNQQVAMSLGTAMMSVVLTREFRHSDNIRTARRIALLKEQAAKRGISPDLSALPPRASTPGFAHAVLHDMAHAYTAVFVVAAILIVLTYLPAAFLPTTPPASRKGPLDASRIPEAVAPA